MLARNFDEVACEGYGRSRLNAEIDSGSACRMYLAVDGSRYRHIRDASGSERDAQPGGHQAHEGRPLRRILDNVGAESISFAASDGSVESEWPHPARKEDERLLLQIPDAQRALASKSMGIRQYRNVTLFEQRSDPDPFGWVRVPQEGQIDFQWRAEDR